MYVGAPLASSIDPSAAVVGTAALARRLTVYAGAGLSAAAPTSLPGAATLAHLIAGDLSNVVDLTGVDEWDLVAVADKIASAPTGTRLLHESIARVAGFDTADPNYAHEVLGLLICEGAVTVLEANYDNCIERGAVPELLPVAVDDRDRITMANGALLKVHGCITRPDSMLATTAELANPPLYAGAELAARLSAGDVAFIGLGSPADYVRASVANFVGRVSPASLVLVDPAIDRWEQSGWSDVVPALAPANRVAMPADEFCDHVLRFYVRDLIRRLRAAIENLDDDHPQRRGTELLVASLEQKTAVRAARWLRALAWKFAVGQSVISSSRVLQGMLALSLLSSDHPNWRLSGGGIALAPTSTDVAILLLVADHAPGGGQMATEAERRVGNARAEGLLAPGCQVIVLCHGHHGRLGPGELDLERGATLADLPVLSHSTDDHLVGGAGSDHLIDSIVGGTFSLVAGDRIIDIE